METKVAVPENCSPNDACSRKIMLRSGAEKAMNALGFRAADVSPDSELLRGLEPSEIDEVLAAASAHQFSAKSLITRQDGPAKRLFLLWKGRARYFFETPNGKKHILIWITPGQIFGGTALALPPSNYLVSTEAVRDSTVLVWDGPAIRDLARRFPRVMMNTWSAWTIFPGMSALMLP
jgi:Cyclic nucleotide-binding domain